MSREHSILTATPLMSCLGAIVEQLSGMKFGEFLKARIFEPLGMKDTIAPDYFDVRAERLTGRLCQRRKRKFCQTGI